MTEVILLTPQSIHQPFVPFSPNPPFFHLHHGIVQIVHAPQRIDHAGGHCGRASKRTVHAAEIVEADMQGSDGSCSKSIGSYHPPQPTHPRKSHEGFKTRIHADRIVGGDRDHCDPDRTAVACRSAGKRGARRTQCKSHRQPCRVDCACSGRETGSSTACGLPTGRWSGDSAPRCRIGASSPTSNSTSRYGRCAGRCWWTRSSPAAWPRHTSRPVGPLTLTAGSALTHWNVTPAGRLLVFDGGQFIYGHGRMAYREGAGHVRPQAASDYKLFGEVLAPKAESPEDARDQRRTSKQSPRRREIKWATSLPFVARSIVLTSDALLVAGGQSLPGSVGRHAPGTFWTVSRKNGTKHQQCQLPAPPVLDGMAFADSGVFISTIDGTIACLRTKNDG